MRNTINIPEGVTAEDMAWHVYIAAKSAASEGFEALANERRELSDEISTLNVTPVDQFNAPCDCSERDPEEIPVYLSPSELDALAVFLGNVTFGDLSNEDDPLQLYRSIREVLDTRERSL